MAKLKRHALILLMFTVVDIVANSVFRELSQNPSYFVQTLHSPGTGKSEFITNSSKIKESSPEPTKTPNFKKQHVNRVSQKQYEVINMLWRKTKIFVDIEPTTVTYVTKHNILSRKAYSSFQRNPFQISLPRPMIQVTTPSYIEFYYIHEIDDRVKQKKSPNFNIDIRFAGTSGTKNNVEFVTNKSLYGLSDYRQAGITPYHSYTLNKKLRDVDKLNFYADIFTRSSPKFLSTYNEKKTINNDKKSDPKSRITSIDIFFENETCPVTTATDDKVNTKNSTSSIPFRGKMKSAVENEISYEKITLEHVNSNNAHVSTQNKTKHSKKHIIADPNKNNVQDNDIDKKSKTTIPNVETSNTENADLSHNFGINSAFANDKVAYNYVNNAVPWSEYRFVAVYVYEPLQVHCDSAGISPHWLITAGSCLARHHKNPGGEGLSAYVTYCGNDWWNPERISYVKYSLVHPKYHPRNRVRRHLYNIGIIQVVNSMVSACPGWTPVSLMSHHFSSSTDGSRGTALGWGLDRYDARYIMTELPKRPLMMYENRLYSDSCPGNIGYSKAKHLEEEGGVKNVYCLSLPPYNGEENDPVHGSLLLVGEKLIALYLQEERRPWGEQSAVYTGTWRHVPWVLDNARESEESDIFTVDI